MQDVFEWLITGGLVGVPVVLLSVLIPYFVSRTPLEEKYRHGSGSGVAGAFDAVWSPSAHEAGMERDRQSSRTAPAPSPGDPPWAIRGSRITLDVGERL